MHGIKVTTTPSGQLHDLSAFIAQPLQAMSQTKGKAKETSDIPSEYWHYLLTRGVRPKSVYAFTQEIGIEESAFYTHAASFESLEASYWASTVKETIEVLDADEDYADYDAEQKLLAFFYTFFAHIQKHRSRFTEFFPPAANLRTTSWHHRISSQRSINRISGYRCLH